jgi:hypothetical protein
MAKPPCLFRPARESAGREQPPTLRHGLTGGSSDGLLRAMKFFQHVLRAACSLVVRSGVICSCLAAGGPMPLVRTENASPLGRAQAIDVSPVSSRVRTPQSLTG